MTLITSEKTEICAHCGRIFNKECRKFRFKANFRGTKIKEDFCERCYKDLWKDIDAYRVAGQSIFWGKVNDIALQRKREGKE